MFIVKSLLLGIGLAMDAVAVSMANGLQNPTMKEERKMSISSAFGFFQFFMPILGYFLLKSFTEFMPRLLKYLSPLSTLILCYLGLRMLISGIGKKKNKEVEESFFLRLPFSYKEGKKAEWRTGIIRKAE